MTCSRSPLHFGGDEDGGTAASDQVVGGLRMCFVAVDGLKTIEVERVVASSNLSPLSEAPRG